MVAGGQKCIPQCPVFTVSFKIELSPLGNSVPERTKEEIKFPQTWDEWKQRKNIPKNRWITASALLPLMYEYSSAI
jgi:hypothetical protein